MTTDRAAAASADRPAQVSLNMRVGGVCAVVGAVVFATVRLLHGDTPASDPQATFAFLAARPSYPLVHIVAVFGALAGLAGLIALAASLANVVAQLLGRLAVASSIVGLAVFSVESTSEGLGLPELARAASGAAPAERAELLRAARAVAEATHGPSLIALAIAYGVALMLYGAAIVLDGYPSWLGWAGALVGAVTFLAAVGLFVRPTIIPGHVLYGELASILVQLWLAAAGVMMMRRAARPAAPAPT